MLGRGGCCSEQVTTVLSMYQNNLTPMQDFDSYSGLSLLCRTLGQRCSVGAGSAVCVYRTFYSCIKKITVSITIGAGSFFFLFFSMNKRN